MQQYTVRPKEAATEAIMAYLIRHQLQRGDRLPSEREMCAMWSLNRSTLRSAISKLIQNGILDVRQGAGIYYAGPKYQRKLQGLKSFDKETSLQKRDYKTLLISFKQIESDKRLSRFFRVVLGTSLWHLSRLRLAEEQPLELESSYFLSDRFPGIDRFDFARESLYRIFEDEYGVVPTHGDETITATRAGDEAALLQIEEEAPIFRIESRTYDQKGVSLEYCQAVARPDRVMLISRMEQISPGGISQ